MWSNKYIGIPYVDNGRSTAGTDCWGLVRLVYKEELNIELPSFFNDYEVSDTERVSELMSQYREGWEQLSLPSENCVVLFRVLGKISHIGVMINEHQFLHTKRKQDSSVESIQNPKWANRVAGFFKYTEAAGRNFASIPSALSATELKIEVEEGFTIGNAYDAIYKNEQLPNDLKDRIILFVDGNKVNKEADWEVEVKDGQRLEYRLLADDENTLRTVAIIAIVVLSQGTASWVTAPVAGSAAAAAAGAGAATGLGMSAGWGLAAQAGVMMVGMSLVNAIFPVRPPDISLASGGMDSSNPQLLLNGSRNEARQYEAIPVVLGTYRLTAPVAAVNYLTVDTDISYLRMLLCWGYGPVNITDVRVGPTLISDYLDDVTPAQVNGYPTDDLTPIYNLYGTDTFQLLPNIEMPYSEPGNVSLTYIPVTGGATVDYISRVVSTPVTSISVSFHFPQGLRGMNRTGSSAGAFFPVAFTGTVEVRPLDNTLTPTGAGTWISPGLSFLAKSVNTVANMVRVALGGNNFDGQTWNYGSGYTNNIVYLSSAGDIGIVAGPAYTTLGDTTTITDGSVSILYYTGKNGTQPVYGTPTYTYGSTTPTLPDGARPMYTVVVYGTVYASGGPFSPAVVTSSSIISTTDVRIANGIVTGGALSVDTTNKSKLNFTAGTTNSSSGALTFGLINQPFYLRKDAFTATSTFVLDANNPSPYEVRVRRTNSALFDFSANANQEYYYNKCFLYLITGVNAKVNAIVPPKGTNLALSAYKIRATDQLNGSLEGINALVSSICVDYELSSYTAVTTATLVSVVSTNLITITGKTTWATIQSKIFVGSVISNHIGFSGSVTVTAIAETATTTILTVSANATSSVSDSSFDITNNLWVARATSNPASLFRYVLQHPANMQAISAADASTKLDIATIQDWHTFCKSNNFMYNAVIVQHKSLLEVLRDICAAGRASPMLSNGKWGVVIDRARSTIVQHFTPHNSWGFEATRVLSTPPHALRVNYINENNEYQSAELTVFSYSNKRISITTTADSTSATASAIIVPTVDTGTGLTTINVTITSSGTIPINTTATVAANSTALTLSTSLGVTTGTSVCTINVPYDNSTASIFETVQLPGITSSATAIKHAKFHLAQAMLRPETYSLYTDMEFLVCNRGDLIRVTHDVPMWGMATGRVKNYLGNNVTPPNTTNIEVSEPVLMQANTAYTIRLRDAGGNSIVRSILGVLTTDYYSTLTISPTITSTEGAANNLFMIGTVNSESAEMIVLGIEPSTNMSGKINFTDYSPAVYSSDTNFTAMPNFGTQITAPIAYSRNFITSVPTIVTASIRSDESVMELSGGSYVYKISVPYTNPANLEKIVTDLEYRMCLTNDTSKSWRFNGNIPLTAGSLLLSDVVEGLQYSLQLRYISAGGFTGPWTPEVTHTIVGKTTVPSAVSGFTAVLEGSFVRFNWNKNPEVDIIGYEIRTANTGWGTTGAIYSGSATTATTVPAAFGVSTTWYITALDAAGLYSTTVSSTSITVTRPNDITSVTPTYSISSTGQATVTLNWTAPTLGASSLGLYKYLVTFTRPTLGAITVDIPATTNTASFNADWEGTATFAVVVKDVNNNSSIGTSTNVVKVAPSVPTAAASPVVVNGAGVTLNWVTPTAGSLPVAGYQLSASNADPKITAYVYKGSASSIDIGTVTSGLNTWYLWAYDTAGKYSATPLTISRTILAPSVPQSITSIYTPTTAIFKWAAPATGDFVVASYILSLTATGMTTKTAVISTTEWEVPVDWVNTTATFNVIAKDIAGFSGATGSTTMTKANPGQVSNVQYAFASTGTGQSTLITWDAPTVGATQQTIKQYNVIVTKPSLPTITTIVQGNSYTVPADWEGTATISIVAQDMVNAVGTALVTNLIKVAPSAPTVPVIVTKGAGINITWTSATAGSLPVAGYQLSTSSTAPQTNAYIYKGSASSIDVASVSTSNTWYLFSYDTAGKYCTTPLTITKTFTGPSTPIGLSAVFTYGTALFKWSAPTTSDFAIDRYELTLSGAGVTTVTAKLYTTDWEIPVGWSNTTATLTIVPVDVAGFAYSGVSNTSTNQVNLQKTAPTAPAVPTLSVIGTDLDVDWADNIQTVATQLGVVSYEIKTSAGTSVWRGSGSKAQLSLIGKPDGVALNYNIYAYDYNDVPSAATAFSYTPTAVTNISVGTYTGNFGNSLTDASLTLNWIGVIPTYGLAGYEVTYDAITVKVNSTTLTISPLPTGWIGSKTFTVKTVDLLGNKSSGVGLSVTKAATNPISIYSAQVIDNNVMLYWSLPTRTSLPISFVRVKKSLASNLSATWATAEVIGDKSGTFTTIFERSAGNYVYWMAAVDTDKQEGTPISFPVTVSQPPDFIFNGEKVSTFNATLSNAIVDTGRIVFPVDTGIQYGQHFTYLRVATMTVVAGGTGYAVNDTFRLNSGTVNATDYATGIVTAVSGGIVTAISITGKGTYSVTPTLTAGATAATSGVGTGLTITITTSTWAAPADQVSAGYTIYVQPTLATGYYEEVFDFGTTLGSSQVTLTLSGSTVDGAPTVITSMSTSNDNVTYSAGYSGASMFSTNFRYVKIRVTASQNDIGKGLYALNFMSVRLDSKIINWSGNTVCATTTAGSPNNADGTLANFGKEFVDISAIAITPVGTTAAYPVYDFKDVVFAGTYSITANVCTVTTTLPHGFSGNAIGQMVRLSFNSGTAPNGVYAITSVSGGTLGTANSYNASTVFTVAITTANTSGSLTAYSQGMRIYLFDGSGARTSGTVSWSIRGN